MEVWYKKLGYTQNPFSLNPFKDKTPWIGQTDMFADAEYYIRSGSIIYVEAPRGEGKTKFLLDLTKSFKGKIIFLNAAKVYKTLNVEELLRKKNGWKGKLFGKKPLDMILFVDNADELSLVNFERIKYYYDQGFIQSIVFTGTSLKKTGFSESMLSRIGQRVIKLNNLSLDEAYELTSRRIGEDLDDEDSLINKELVKKIHIMSKKNHRLFLINLHRVFEEMAYDKDTKIEVKHLDVLKDKLDAEDEEEFDLELEADVVPRDRVLIDQKGNKLMKVGEYYRNPKEDMFCSDCGAIVNLEDSSCPECGAEFEVGDDNE